MARFRTWPIGTAVWADPDWVRLSREAQLVGLFLMTYRTGGPWPAARIVRWTGWDRKMVDQALAELGLSAYSGFCQSEPRRRRMSQKIRREIFRRDGNACLRCGATDQLTVDHVYPVSLGGADDLENLQTLCHSCNARKGAKVEDPVDKT